MTNEQRERLIHTFVDLRRRLQQIAGKGELTQGEFLVLRRIKIEHEGNIEKLSNFRAVRISQYLSMPPPAVSRIFNSLESRGLIQRDMNHSNRRSVIVSLTKSGEVALYNAESRVRHFMDKLITEMGDDDAIRLLELLETVTSIFAKEEPSEGGFSLD